jgi:hypothetical protein
MLDQRLLMYIVISMPKRMSTASGVSHFMTYLLNHAEQRISRPIHHPRVAGMSIADRLEMRLMIFMSLHANPLLGALGSSGRGFGAVDGKLRS